MELRQLRYFLALAEHRNFNCAAEALGITQQALSHSIAQLEKSLNTKLFDRALTGSTITAVGRAFEKRARLICGESDLAMREVDALTSGSQGQVRFGVSVSLASQLLPPIVSRYAKSRPKVELKFAVDLSERLLDQLAHGDLEFVVVTPGIEATARRDLEHEVFQGGFEVDGNFLLMRPNHPLLDLKAPGLDDIVQFPWIMPETIPMLSRTIFDFFSRNRVNAPRYVVRTDSGPGTKALVMQSDFIALTGREMAQAELDAGLLAGFPLPGLNLRRPAQICYRERSPLQPACAALVALFREHLSAAEPEARAG